MNRKLFIIHNPIAGRRNPGRLEQVVTLLETAGAELEIRATQARGDAEAIAREASGRAPDAIVACGGDGTINEVVNGLSASSVPLGIMPMGTVNVLAAELGISAEPRAIAETILRAEPTSLWPGVVNGRRFTLMAGIGFDAHVVAGLDVRLKRVLGRGAYGIEALRQWLGWRGAEYQVRIDGAEMRAAWVIVAKSRYYGGRFVCAPDASLLNPELQVCMMERAGRVNLARFIAAIVRGRLCELPDCRILTAREIQIAGGDHEPVQADGDTVGRLPARIAIDSNPLRVLMPTIAGRA